MLGVVFHPLGASYKSIFFSIPACKYECAIWLPSFGYKSSKSFYDCIERRGSGARITCAVHPCIAMVSENDFLTCFSRNATDDIVYWCIHEFDFIDEID